MKETNSTKETEMESLSERALNELREWHEHDKALNSPNVRNETIEIISEIELHFADKGTMV